MKVGVSLQSYYVVDDPREGARWMIERARAAADAELDSLFVGDHHVVPVPYYQNSVILARLLAEWHHAPAGALYLLPLWHPVLLAEQVGTLAALMPGRFILMCAQGAGEEQFAGMGVELQHRPSRFTATLDVVRRLLAGEEVTADEPIPIRKASVAPIPTEHVEIWVGASAPPAIDRAARLGDAWLGDAWLTLEDAHDQVDQYRVACERHRREPASVAIRRDVYVGESEADVEKFARPVAESGYRGFDPGALVIGTVDQVVEQLAEYRALGFTDVIVRQLVADQSAAIASIERLAAVKALLAD